MQTHVSLVNAWRYVGGDTSKYGICQAGCLRRNSPRHLNPLTHHNVFWRMQIENLKRSKAERISKLWLQMPSFWKIGSKHSVKLTYGAYASQKQPRSESSVLLAKCIHLVRCTQKVTHTRMLSSALRRKVKCRCTSWSEFCHIYRRSHVYALSCSPAAKAEASIARLPSGRSSSTSSAPSEHPRYR